MFAYRPGNNNKKIKVNTKPELIVISQNLMGGGSSFHRNMVENRPDDFFDIKCIYLDPLNWIAKRLENYKYGENDVVFVFGNESEREMAKRLNKCISNRNGAIVANLPEELITIDYFPKSNKTVFFICHDKGFLYLTQKYCDLIDVFIAHNIEIYGRLLKILPKRRNDIYYIPHGVQIQNYRRTKNENLKLRLVFLARHVKLKGIYDLPKIDDALLENGVEVEWTILGDGEERTKFMNEVSHRGNFLFFTPENTSGVIEILKNQDIYILPSSHDGLPVSLLEAMSVGCVPMVYNFSEGIKEVITNDIGYVVDINDIGSITKNIILLNNNRNLLFDFGQNSMRKIKNDYNIKIQAEKYFSLYKNYESLKKKSIFSISKIERKYSNSKIVCAIFILMRRLKKIVLK